MADILHEFWRDENGGQFGPVSAEYDRFRTKMTPNLSFGFEIWAASWRDAMREYEERAYSEFGKPYNYLSDTIYIDEEEAEQRAYLAVRGNFR